MIVVVVGLLIVDLALIPLLVILLVLVLLLFATRIIPAAPPILAQQLRAMMDAMISRAQSVVAPVAQLLVPMFAQQFPAEKIIAEVNAMAQKIARPMVARRTLASEKLVITVVVVCSCRVLKIVIIFAPHPAVTRMPAPTILVIPLLVANQERKNKLVPN